MLLILCIIIAIIFIFHLSAFWDEEAREQLKSSKEETERNIMQVRDDVELNVELTPTDIINHAFLEAFKWTMIIGGIAAILSNCSAGDGASWCGRGAC